MLNHNTETVPRLYRQVRLGARYERSLEMLAHAKAARPQIPTKSGLMLGLGETNEEAPGAIVIFAARRRYPYAGPVPAPLAETPSDPPLCPARGIRPLRRPGYEMGFPHVEAGPLVRSSYHAAEGAK